MSWKLNPRTHRARGVVLPRIVVNEMTNPLALFAPLVVVVLVTDQGFTNESSELVHSCIRAFVHS